jgi:DNA-binding Lrp family transcriptional regulator
VRLDALDEQIVALLLDDGRASFADIGAKVGLSAPAVKRRVDRLRQQGVIRGFTAKVDPRELGWTTEAYVELYCQGRTSPSAIRDGIARFPEVVSAATVTGEADALVHIRTADIEHFEAVLERMNAEPYVVRTKSALVLTQLVDRLT